MPAVGQIGVWMPPGWLADRPVAVGLRVEKVGDFVNIPIAKTRSLNRAVRRDLRPPRCTAATPRRPRRTADQGHSTLRGLSLSVTSSMGGFGWSQKIPYGDARLSLRVRAGGATMSL